MDDISIPLASEALVDGNKAPAASWYRIFSTWATAFNDLARSLTNTIDALGAVDVLTARGDVLTRDAAGYVRVPIGAAGTFLSSDGVDPSWQPSSAALHLLASGDASGATLDIVLSTYTAYRGIIVELYALIPATDGVHLYCQFSTDEGANWLATNYRNGTGGMLDTPGYVAGTGATAGTALVISNTTAGALIGNGSDEGISCTVKLMGWQLTNVRPRVTWFGDYVSNAATPANLMVFGGGHHITAQDVTALRFLFSSGDITSGKYAVYGLT